MKIAVFTPSWPPGIAANGIATYASYLVPALRALGHIVYVLSGRTMEGKCDDPYTVDLRRFTSAPSLWDRAFRRIAPDTAFFKARTSSLVHAIKRLEKEHKIDVLEMEESFGWTLALSRLNLLPIVVRLHGPWFLNGNFNNPARTHAIDSRRQKREGRGIKSADYVTSPAAQVLTDVRARYGIKLSRSRVISNPIEITASSDTWSLDTCDRNVLLFVGRFDEHKGADLVLRAFAELNATRSNLRLVFIGPDRGVRTANGEIIHYEKFVRANLPESCQSAIEYRGTVSHPEVMRLRKRAILTISASRYEVLPYSILEAMSLGCPIVATAVGGIPEAVRDSLNGMLARPDVTSLVAACKCLLDHPDLAARLGKQGWHDCASYFNPQKIAEETVDAYFEAIRHFKSRDQQKSN
jgi:glycosyltransferase involved in cell wall biosynthesis